MDDFNATVLSRLPLAEAVLKILSHVASTSFLELVYERFRGRTYSKVLTLSTIFRLLTDAIVQHQGSGKQSFCRAVENKTSPVTDSAVYRKIGRLPLDLSEGFLSECTKRLEAICPAPMESVIPASLRSMTLIAIDGKKLKNVAKRIKPLRGLPGSVLGAKVLVGLRLDTGHAVAFHADKDGEKNDCPLVPGLLSQIRKLDLGRMLYLIDRQFCGSKQIDEFSEGNNYFLIRRTTTAKFDPDMNRPSKKGKDINGRNYIESWGDLGTGEARRYVRQISLERPGEETILLITNLLDSEVYPASDLLAAYHMRWEIECVFQKITEVFDLHRLIGGKPEAIIFQCAFCLFLYNVMKTICRLIAESQNVDEKEVSCEQVFTDLKREVVSMDRVADRDVVAKHFDESTDDVETVRERVKELLRTCWNKRWMKYRSKKKRPDQNRAKQSGAHTSVFRAQQKYKESIHAEK